MAKPVYKNNPFQTQRHQISQFKWQRPLSYFYEPVWQNEVQGWCLLAPCFPTKNSSTATNLPIKKTKLIIILSTNATKSSGSRQLSLRLQGSPGKTTASRRTTTGALGTITEVPETTLGQETAIDVTRTTIEGQKMTKITCLRACIKKRTTTETTARSKRRPTANGSTTSAERSRTPSSAQWRCSNSRQT